MKKNPNGIINKTGLPRPLGFRAFRDLAYVSVIVSIFRALAYVSTLIAQGLTK